MCGFVQWIKFLLWLILIEFYELYTNYTFNDFEILLGHFQYYIV